jgi:hypothetical protein
VYPADEPHEPRPTIADYADDVKNWLALGVPDGEPKGPEWNFGNFWIVGVTARQRPPEQWNEPVVENPEPITTRYTQP